MGGYIGVAVQADCCDVVSLPVDGPDCIQCIARAGSFAVFNIQRASLGVAAFDTEWGVCGSGS